METLEELKNAWNAQADKYNQWDELGHDEIVALAQQRAIAKLNREIERLRGALRMTDDFLRDNRNTDDDRVSLAMDYITLALRV